MENSSQNNSISQEFSPTASERSSGSPISVESVLRRTSNSGLKHAHRQIDGLKKIRRMAANARERCRMHTVNYAFDKLRTLVPCYPSDRKLSKIATLKLATMYIADLAALLRDTNQSSLLPSDDIKLDCMLPQQPRRYNLHTDSFNPLAIKSESNSILAELELDSISNHGDQQFQNFDHIEMSKMVHSNFDFSDQLATPGWICKQNEIISPISDKYDQILCNQVSYEYNVPKHIQTK